MADLGVLVPYPAGVAPLAALPGVTVIHYEAGAELPAAAVDAAVLIPPFLATAEAVGMAHKLPSLRLVQLLTAGAEAWSQGLPDGVLLSDCRGAHGSSAVY